MLIVLKMHDNLWSFFFLCVHVCNQKGKQKEKLGGKREVDRRKGYI